MPWGGDEEEGECPTPRIVTFQHHCSFCINQWIERSTFQYFNATVRLQGQQDMFDSDYIYFFVFFFFTNSLLEETWKKPNLLKCDTWWGEKTDFLIQYTSMSTRTSVRLVFIWERYFVMACHDIL